MTSRTRSLDGPVIHSFDCEGCGAGVTVGTLVAQQSAQGGRDVIGRFGDDVAVAHVMAALATDGACMVVGIGTKPGRPVMAGIATRIGRQVVGRFVIHARIGADMAG